jgi:hypothetical protein
VAVWTVSAAADCSEKAAEHSEYSPDILRPCPLAGALWLVPL